MPSCSPFSLRSARTLSRRGVLTGGTALTAGALVLGGRRAAVAHDDPQGFTGDEQAQIDTIVTSFLAGSGTPGAILGLWFPERGTWVKTYGVGNIDTGVPPAIGDRFRIGGITKTFVATLLLQLVDEGAITLDTPLSDFELDLPGSESATLAQVLGMTSGIYSYTEDDAFSSAYSADPMMSFTPQDALDIARAHAPDFPPGEGIHDSDTNTIIAGLIAEQLTGAPLEQLVTGRILTPQLLSATSFPTEPAMPDPFMSGYAPAARDLPVRDVTTSNPAVFWAAGAMISNLNDLAVWVEQLTNGSLFSPDTQAARLQTRPLDPNGSFGYGLGIMELAGFYGHAGSTAGYSAIAMRHPGDGATIVAATNCSGENGSDAETIALQILHTLLPDRVAMPGSPVAAPGATPVSS